MKRKWNTLLAGTLALMMVLVGTGYAYWSDTLNVTTKASTGELDVTFVDLGLYAQYDNEDDANNWSIIDGVKGGAAHTDTGYVASNFFTDSDHNTITGKGAIATYTGRAQAFNDISFNAELVNPTEIGKKISGYAAADKGSDSIAITLNQLYPGYAQAFRTDIVNLGSLAARLSNIQFTTATMDNKELTSNLKQMLGVAVYIDKETNGSTTNDTFKLANAVGAANCFTMGGVDFVRLSALENKTVCAALTKAVSDGLLLAKPDGQYRMDMFYAIGMAPDAEGKYTSGTAAKAMTNATASEAKDAKTENKGVTITMNMSWDQFNQGITPETTNILENQNAAR